MYGLITSAARRDEPGGEGICSQLSDLHGVLILSELAGAANELSEALLVNPLDSHEMAPAPPALDQALTMPPEEQKRKLQLMQQRLKDYDVISVAERLPESIAGCEAPAEVGRDEVCDLIHPPGYCTALPRPAGRRSLLLDYEGTLVPYARHPREAMPDKNLLRLLASLGEDPKTDLTIIQRPRLAGTGRLVSQCAR